MPALRDARAGLAIEGFRIPFQDEHEIEMVRQGLGCCQTCDPGPNDHRPCSASGLHVTSPSEAVEVKVGP